MTTFLNPTIQSDGPIDLGARAAKDVEETFRQCLVNVQHGHGSVRDQLAEAREWLNDPANTTPGSPWTLRELALLDAVEKRLDLYIATRQYATHLEA